MFSHNTRRRTKPRTELPKSLIDPIDWLAETVFSILVWLTFTLAFKIIWLSDEARLPISDETINELLIGALGAVLAWGLIDGIMYALLSMFERGERHRVLMEIQTAQTEQAAVEVIADDMDYLLEPITGEEERTALYSSMLSHLRTSKPRSIGFKGEDFVGALGHVLVAILAVLPSLAPIFVLRHDYNLAIRVSILVSFIVLFGAGFRWGQYTGSSPWKTGLLLVAVAAALVLIAIPLGG